MSKNVFTVPDKQATSPFQMAIVAEVYDDGVSLYFDGSPIASTKHFQILEPVSVAKGRKVLCAKTGETSYVVLGSIGTPASPFHSGDKISFFGNTPVTQAQNIVTVSTSGSDAVKIDRLIQNWNRLVAALDYRGYGLIK